MRIAHISKGGVEQPLNEHLQAVAAWCARFAQKTGLMCTAQLTAMLHDMGKAARQFHAYLLYCHTHPGDNSLRGKVTHSTQGAKYIYERYGAGNPLARLTASVVALGIAGHHGGLMDCLSPEGEQPFYERLVKDDPKLCYKEVLEQFPLECSAYSELDALFEAAVQEIKAFAERSMAQGLKGPFILHLMVRLLFSYLIDADRYDAYRFEASLPAEACEQPEPPWTELSAKLEVHLAGFDASTSINRLRGDISRRCTQAAQKPCGIYQLSVPTGGGKTLSSLRFALEHARLHGKERIYYIIPFTTIIDQNAKEIRDILQRDDLILEHHSNIVADKERRASDDGEDDEEHEECRLLTERWNSPIILTTMVQFLNTLYASGTRAARRMHNLVNAVLIFDEIQSVPPNCIHLLTGALNFLNRLCGSTILLCTATQPELSEVLRPLLMSRESQIVENLDEVFQGFKRTRVIDARVDGGYSIDALCGFALEKLGRLRTGLIVSNTKRDARNFYQEITRRNKELPRNRQYYIFYLSTNLCPAHRKKLLDEILRRLPKDRVICVSTQLIEAGINISFQCVIRALAGLDSVAQAAGRCNRHKEYEGCREVYLVNVAGEKLDSLPGIKYGQQATLRVLDDLHRDPSLSGVDLIAPEALRRYFHYYYQMPEIKNSMDYPVKTIPNATLYDLLGNNVLGCKTLENRGIAKPPLWQAFGTAGDHFEAIESITTAVIVPYGEGEALIGQLRKEELPIKERADLLRKAQQYSVNVFSQTMKQLEHDHAVEVLPGGVLALAKEYYDDQMGVTTEGKPMEALFG